MSEATGLGVLRRLVGRWDGDEVLLPAPGATDRRHARGTMTLRMVCDDQFLVNDYEQRVDDAVVYRGHGVYGWEPLVERFTMFWFDSLGDGGPIQPVLGRFQDDCLRFHHVVDTGFRQYVYEFVANDEITFRIETSEGGGSWATVLQGRYRKT